MAGPGPFVQPTAASTQQTALWAGREERVHKAICRGGVRNKFHRWSRPHLMSELFSRGSALPLTSLVTLR